MECFVKFPPSLYSCQTHHLALLKHPVPAKRSTFTLLFMDDQKIQTSHSTQHTADFTPFTQHTMHSLTHTHTQTNKHTAVATRVLGRAKKYAGGTVWVRGGAVQRFPPCFRYNRHFSQTNLTCTNL